MIPVQKQNEPDNFDRKVTKPAEAFLEKNPGPTKKELDNRPYWRNSLDDLYFKYRERCAYSGLWFQRDAVSVDHYEPVSATWKTNPKKAYEWDNFRLASRSMNTEKGDFQDVVDPFDVQPAWFVIKFPSMLITSGAELSPVEKEKVEVAIRRLKLNINPKYKDYRRSLIRKYCEKYNKLGKLSARDWLEEIAPFIAVELERQQLTEKITEMMIYPKTSK